MLARVLGPFFVIATATTVARPDMRTLLSDFEASTPWPWITGALMLLAALVIVALHQYWHGAAAITVSVVGWLLVLRAVLLMTFPQAFMSATEAAFELTPLWVGVEISIGLVGLWLTFVGWRPEPNQPVAQAETPRSGGPSQRLAGRASR
ncbi:hypothetical protein [Mycobacterium angelicum]|uniref:DUF4345 domain-containing protein n=1 Tax=Mycobacterium angelicum TaxID=470074 RepID=A0A1W9ZRW0_MYCAN|nr:hypothetical protein [Mycobacterium angelicum]MCV7199358.1 hypothetical protein [Mycobacterium angelicum]ORA20529.1 hypothetical protein BST12_15100 [Mycobacterium angelicum]